MNKTLLLGTLIITATNLVCYIIIKPPVELSITLTVMGLSAFVLLYLLTQLFNKL